MEIPSDKFRSKSFLFLTLFLQEFFQIIKAVHFDVLHQTADTIRRTKRGEGGRISFGDQFNNYYRRRLHNTANKENNYSLYLIRNLSIFCHYLKKWSKESVKLCSEMASSDQKSFSLYKQNASYKINQIALSLLCRRLL